MKKAFGFLILSLAMTVSAFAENYPVLDRYSKQAEELGFLSSRAQTTEEWAQASSGTRVLIQTGVEIMNLYASRNPSCATQFEAFIRAIPQMENLSVEEVHRLYHDGKGLPSAPRHCYFGRSQVVHPMMNLIRMKNAVTDEVRSEINEEIEEVIEHLEKIRRNLDNPPG